MSSHQIDWYYIILPVMLENNNVVTNTFDIIGGLLFISYFKKNNTCI